MFVHAHFISWIWANPKLCATEQPICNLYKPRLPKISKFHTNDQKKTQYTFGLFVENNNGDIVWSEWLMTHMKEEKKLMNPLDGEYFKQNNNLEIV